jgi:hypothetical protein
MRKLRHADFIRPHRSFVAISAMRRRDSCVRTTLLGEPSWKRAGFAEWTQELPWCACHAPRVRVCRSREFGVTASFAPSKRAHAAAWEQLLRAGSCEAEAATALAMQCMTGPCASNRAMESSDACRSISRSQDEPPRQHDGGVQRAG